MRGARRTTPCNNKVGVCAHYVRSGETAHPRGEPSPTSGTLHGIVGGEIAGRGPDREFCCVTGRLRCRFAKPEDRPTLPLASTGAACRSGCFGG